MNFKARVVRLVNDHQVECSSLTAAAAVVAKQRGVGKDSLRRWVIQSQVHAIARALAMGPLLMMFDKPTIALKPSS